MSNSKIDGFKKIQQEYFRGHSRSEEYDPEEELQKISKQQEKEKAINGWFSWLFPGDTDIRFFVRELEQGRYLKAILRFILLACYEFLFWCCQLCLFTNKKFIFVVGMPHTGTTLLQRVLLSHDLIAGTKGELNTYFIGGKYFDQNCHSEIEEFSEREVVRIKKRLIFRSCSFLKKGKYILNKNPINSLAVNALEAAFPGSTFVIVYRNPENTVSSLINSMPNNGEVADRLSPVDKRLNPYPLPRPKIFMELLADCGYTQTRDQFLYVYDYLYKFYCQSSNSKKYWFSFDRLVATPNEELTSLLKTLEIGEEGLSISIPDTLSQKESASMAKEVMKELSTLDDVEKFGAL